VDARLQFGILGPLEVRRDGAPVAIGGGRQRALLALLLCNANRVLSRDRLIEDLLSGVSSGSPERVLRVQVSRLRTALADGNWNGSGNPDGVRDRLIARAPGYVLLVEPGELDLQLFEDSVADGRSALAEGDPTRAAAVLREADALWRGRPLADFEFEPFARSEVERLDEIRLLAVEDRIEAELALGRHAVLCGELTALTSEYPLRERLRLQLMLALYRSGRQADALAVYRQTTRLLREELGLEPSRRLRELEHAILEQDESLDTDAEVPVAELVGGPDVCPFNGLAFFDRDDAQYFFGRERLVAELIVRAPGSGLVGLVGASGIGKSSVLRAGVLAALGIGALPGSAGWRQVVMRPGNRPCDQLTRALAGEPLQAVLTRLAPDERLVLAVDQLEELFTACEDERQRTEFLDQLWTAAIDERRRVLVIAALRGDFYAHVGSHPGFAELLSNNHVLVRPMDRDELMQAIVRPAARVGLNVEAPLVDALVSDAAAQAGGLPLLSAMLVELWSARDGRTLPFGRYRASGGMQAAVARMAEAAYATLAEPQRAVARGVMLRLADERDGGLVRRRASIAELERIETAGPVIAALTDARLLTVSEEQVELSHEALLREWPRYRAWLDDDRAGRRLHAHLTAAAADWDGGGRDPSELYRGARLAGALDWAAQDPGRPNSLEREFLDHGRRESERVERRRRGQNRLLRGLLVAVGALLLVAIGAAVLAKRDQQIAAAQARVSLARQLGAEAVTEPRLDMAMLMAREAVALDRSPQNESALLSTLLRSPAVTASISLPGPSATRLAFDPDGATLAIGDTLGYLRFLDARSHRLVGEPLADLLGGQAPVYSADGTLIAYRSGDCASACVYFIVVRDARTLQMVAGLGLPAGAPLAVHEPSEGGIAISPSDRVLYCAYWVPGTGARSIAYIQRWALPSGRALPAARVGIGPLLSIRLIDSGSRLLVLGAQSVSQFDARTMRWLGSTTIGRAAAAASSADISPNGLTAAIGSATGVVSLVDTATGAVRTAERGQRPSVAGVIYGHDGRTVITVGSDDVVTVWDVRTARPVDVLTGPPADVIGAALTPDGRTLYTSSDDGVVLKWDLSGSEAFVGHMRLAPAYGCCRPPSPPAPPLTVAPGGSHFAVRIAASTVGVFSTQTLQELTSFTVSDTSGGITALAWSPAAEEIAVGGHSGLVELWSVSGAPRRLRSLVGLHAMFGQPEAIQSVAFSPDGRLVAASDEDIVGSSEGVGGNTESVGVAVWRTASGALAFAPAWLDAEAADDAVTTGDDLVAFAPAGRRLAISNVDGSIVVLNTRTGVTMQAVQAPAGATALAFSPRGTLVAGTPSGTVLRWNPVTGQEVGSSLVVSPDAVTGIAFDGTGQRFATAGRGEGVVRLWDSAGQQQGPALATDPGGTAAVAFTGSGVLLVADDEGYGFTWPMSLGAWERDACAVAGRNLTRGEWSQLVIGQPYAHVCA
jgi:DNA-binding SARP family transcriptional activator/WD40 repeat protein